MQSVSFKLRAKVRGQEVTPETIPLGRFNRFNAEVEQLILGSLKSAPVDDIHARITSGSYALDIELPAAVYLDLRSDLERIAESGMPDGVDPKRLEVVTRWQNEASEAEDLVYEIAPGWQPDATLRIDHSHRLLTPEPKPVWFATEKYLNGEITTAGGATQANLQLRVPGYARILTIAATREQLKSLTIGRLYEDQMIRVRGEERLDTGELRNLELIEFIEHRKDYDEDYINALIEKGTRRWADVPDANAWLRELRGYGDDV
ncbi:MAG: hypothetical protein ACPGSB_11130 [Opitutales bacterium]